MGTEQTSSNERPVVAVAGLRRSQIRFAAFAAIVLALAVAITFDYRSVVRFDESQGLVERATAKAVVHSVQEHLDGLRRLVRHFTHYYGDQIVVLSRHVDDDKTLEFLETQLHTLFPDFLAFTIADGQGTQLLADWNGNIEAVCRRDMAAYAGGLASGHEQVYDPVIHPNPNTYHFDIMVPWESGGHNGIFFVSFPATEISSIITRHQPPGHRFIFLNRDDPRLIEVVAQGGRDVLGASRHDYHLSDTEWSEVEGLMPVPGTRWILAVSNEQKFYAATLNAIHAQSISGFVACVLVIVLGAWAISRSEAQRGESVCRLMASESSLANAQRIAGLGNWDWDIRENHLYWSDEIYRIFGLKPREFAADYEAFLARIHVDDRAAVEQAVGDALNGAGRYNIEHRIVLDDGSEKLVREEGEVAFDGDTPVRMSGTVHDISRVRRQEEELRILWKAIEQVPTGVYLTTLDGVIEYTNSALSNATGYSREELLGATPACFKSGYHSDGFFWEMWGTITSGREWHGEIYNRRRDGSHYWADTVICPIRDDRGEPTHYLAIAADITERKAAQEKIESMAYFDPLTHLPNRTLFQQRVERAEQLAVRGDSGVAVLFIDLDGFKAVNDTMGHEAGDRLLIQVGERINACVRDTDTVARVGGDEFIALLMLEPAEVRSRAIQVAQRIIDALSAPIPLQQNQAQVGASVGIALYPGSAHNLDECIRLADMAMYQAKTQGKGRYVISD